MIPLSVFRPTADKKRTFDTSVYILTHSRLKKQKGKVHSFVCLAAPFSTSLYLCFQQPYSAPVCIRVFSSSWYNRNGWLGVKHQVTYLLVQQPHSASVCICVFSSPIQHQSVPAVRPAVRLAPGLISASPHSGPESQYVLMFKWKALTFCILTKCFPPWGLLIPGGRRRRRLFAES